MPIKGVLEQNHIPVNKYELGVPDVGTFTFTKISSFDREINMVDLPDRTRASGGVENAVEFTATLPKHHLAEKMLIENWYRMATAGTKYKYAATLTEYRLNGEVGSTLMFTNLWVQKITEPEKDMANEGEMAVIEITFQADEVTVIL